MGHCHPISRRTFPVLRGLAAASGGALFYLLLGGSCGRVAISPGAERPDGATTLTVTADPSALVAQLGVDVTLTATASGGLPPLLFRWDQNAGPVELELSEVTATAIDVGGLTEPGRYVFRVVVTDRTGATASDFVVVETTDAIETTVPTLAIVNQATPLAVSIGEAPPGTTLSWSVTRGTATLDNAEETTATLIASTGETIGVRLTVLIPSGGATSPIERNFEIVSVFNLRPEVLFETSLGGFTMRLDAEAAPGHTANMLAYVDDRFYDGLLFHRAACTPNGEAGGCDPFVVQGGGFERIDGALVEREPTRDPVASESPNGLSNGALDSVALALSGGDVNSGRAQFFINLSAGNAFLDDQGFTVFGEVVSGREVVDAIAAVETTNNPLLGGELSLPVVDVIIERVTRVFP